jgi:hypothetical protein
VPSPDSPTPPALARYTLARLGFGTITDAQLLDAHRRELGRLDDELLARLDQLANPLIASEPRRDATDEEAQTFHALLDLQRAIREAHRRSLRAIAALPREVLRTVGE